MTQFATAPVARDSEAVPFADCRISASAQQAAAEVLASGWVTTGPQVLAFETEFAAAVGAEHAVAVSSCTAALELSLRAMSLPPDSEVLVPSLTFCGALHAIVHAGLTPVMVDIEPTTGLVTPETVRAAARGCRPRAMIALHLAGAPVDVAELAAAAGLGPQDVVEDAAHALGTVAGGRPVGSGPARATCFSFYATKNLPIGEGGMVTTADADLAERIRRARLHGMSADAWRRYLPGGSAQYTVVEAGLKANMTDLQAAIGRAQLGWLPVWQLRRADLAAWYDEELGEIPGVRLPHRPTPVAGHHAWHLYAVAVWGGAARRDAVAEALTARRIGTSVHFPPAHRMPYFARWVTQPLPGTDAYADATLSLPLYPALSHAHVQSVGQALREAVADRPHIPTARGNAS